MPHGQMSEINVACDRTNAVNAVTYVSCQQQHRPDARDHFINQNLFCDGAGYWSAWNFPHLVHMVTGRPTVLQIVQIPHPAIETIATEDVIVADGFRRNLVSLFNEQLAVRRHDGCNFCQVSEFHVSSCRQMERKSRLSSGCCTAKLRSQIYK